MTLNTVIDSIKNANTTTIFISILIITIIILVIYNVVKMNQLIGSQSIQVNKTEPLVDVKHETHPNKIVLYYAHWCGACNEFKSEWQKLKNELQNYNLNTIAEEHECEKESKLCDAHNITQYPTLILYTSNGTKINYPSNYPRTTETIIGFIRQHV